MPIDYANARRLRVWPDTRPCRECGRPALVVTVRWDNPRVAQRYVECHECEYVELYIT